METTLDASKIGYRHTAAAGICLGYRVTRAVCWRLFLQNLMCLDFVRHSNVPRLISTSIDRVCLVVLFLFEIFLEKGGNRGESHRWSFRFPAKTSFTNLIFV